MATKKKLGVEAVTALLVGQPIMALSMGLDGVMVTTPQGVLKIAPTRFEELHLTLGRADITKATDAEAEQFLAGRTIQRAQHVGGDVALVFDTGETLQIGATPDIEFDTRPTYTIRRLLDEEIL